jgi:hypothetical protein
VCVYDVVVVGNLAWWVYTDLSLVEADCHERLTVTAVGGWWDADW